MTPVPNSFPSPLPPLPVGSHLPGGHGFDPAVPPNTTEGFHLNHLMLRIRDPSESLHFYIDLMGLRTVFAMNTGPCSIYYLGHPQTDAERADPKLYAQNTVSNEVLTTTKGLIELVHIHGTEKLSKEEYKLQNGNVAPFLGFGHVGFTVPDVPTALKRLTENGVKVLKDVGVAEREHVPITEWESEKFGVGIGELHAGYKHVLSQIGFVEDPNGYWIELVPQNMK
ncbi:hypothetical protein EYB25_000362 [Talaromyces marneffei]|uniref:Lactoylglutathione lyase (Glo1), putative n=2 Tax=Talaromyces marneffei TaxID=37727 RepID=B6Q755_TALMQ|nr:uncharacterized protein EYB26_001991 [Talaromyces marneffei]EEA28720.1 lactoylglutathione lyase (Glo1), putative [Talaromyces marneffei ATCC 18224]KAE8555664.1 hypothetical protein EYB25_000362 [Talaromyces marneffei]QGA14338.1 hypothetical protein EYB26_001991 [Talaromyces marneffei]